VENLTRIELRGCYKEKKKAMAAHRGSAIRGDRRGQRGVVQPGRELFNPVGNRPLETIERGKDSELFSRSGAMAAGIS